MPSSGADKRGSAPDDGSIRRFIAFRFRYDPVRRQRRDLVFAAFDNEPEYQSSLDRQSAGVLARQARGEAGPFEHVSGKVHEAGHRRKTARSHGAEARPGAWRLAEPDRYRRAARQRRNSPSRESADPQALVAAGLAAATENGAGQVSPPAARARRAPDWQASPGSLLTALRVRLLSRPRQPRRRTPR